MAFCTKNKHGNHSAKNKAAYQKNKTPFRENKTAF